MATAEKMYSNSVIATLNDHVSIRKYTDQEIPDHILHEILEASRRSPTSSNMQAYSLIVVTNQVKKNKLTELAGDQQHIRDCPVFIAVCADVNRLEVATQMHGKKLAKNLENAMVSTVDAALVGMSLSTAAESYGLGTVMIGGMRNHPREVAELLDFPDGVFVVYGLCIGFPAEKPQQKPRLPHQVTVHNESYDQRNIRPELQQYDHDLAEHYRSQGRRSPDAAWTGIMATKFSKPRRADLLETLREMGFVFDG